MLVLIAFPVLTAALLALLVDRQLGALVYARENGGPMLWQHLFWFFDHPEVYIIALPSFGADDIREIVRNPEEIRRLSQRTGNLCARVMAAEETKGLRLNETPECVNPHCAVPLTTHGKSGRGSAGRCDPCYDYRNAHDGTDRPRELVERYRARQEKRREYAS
jgi:hypothetical protein